MGLFNNTGGKKSPGKIYPFTRAEIQAMPVRKSVLEPDGRGGLKETVTFSGFTPSRVNYENINIPKRRPNNRKVTPGRQKMNVPVMVDEKTKWGVVKRNTGKVKTVYLANPMIKTQIYLSFDKQ